MKIVLVVQKVTNARVYDGIEYGLQCNAMQLDNTQEAQQDSCASKSQTGGKCLALCLYLECR